MHVNLLLGTPKSKIWNPFITHNRGTLIVKCVISAPITEISLFPWPVFSSVKLMLLVKSMLRLIKNKTKQKKDCNCVWFHKNYTIYFSLKSKCTPELNFSYETRFVVAMNHLSLLIKTLCAQMTSHEHCHIGYMIMTDSTGVQPAVSLPSLWDKTI